MSHYGHESIPDAKCPSEKGNKSLNSAIYPWKMGLALKKIVFMSRIVLLDPELTPPPKCQFQQFPSRGKFFHFVNFLDLLMRKEQQQPPPPPPRLINFAKIWSEHVLSGHLSPRPDRAKEMGKFSNDSFCQKCPNRVSTTRGGENSHQLHLGFRSTVKEALAHV